MNCRWLSGPWRSRKQCLRPTLLYNRPWVCADICVQKLWISVLFLDLELRGHSSNQKFVGSNILSKNIFMNIIRTLRQMIVTWVMGLQPPASRRYVPLVFLFVIIQQNLLSVVKVNSKVTSTLEVIISPDCHKSTWWTYAFVIYVHNRVIVWTIVWTIRFWCKLFHARFITGQLVAIWC